MERDVPGGAIAADVLAHETLTDQVPLKGGAVQERAVPVELRVGAPGDRAVIDDHVVYARLGGSVTEDVVARVVLHVAAHADAQVPQDDVVGAVDEPDAPVPLRLPA